MKSLLGGKSKKDGRKKIKSNADAKKQHDQIIQRRHAQTTPVARRLWTLDPLVVHTDLDPGHSVSSQR
jgi:hypothetical protein